MKNAELIKKLYECVAACEYCANACLEENMEEMATCIRTDQVCASVCSSLATVLSTNFEPIEDFVHYCQFVCKICKEECEKHTMEHCLLCAKTCGNCIEACQIYLKKTPKFTA